MQWNLKNTAWLAVCIISYLVAIWVCFVNIQEISDRAEGHYTFFSQRAYLTDGEAIIYFGLWTTAFIVLFILSLKNAFKERISRAGVYGVILIGSIVASYFVDMLFYNPLV